MKDWQLTCFPKSTSSMYTTKERGMEIIISYCSEKSEEKPLILPFRLLKTQIHLYCSTSQSSPSATLVVRLEIAQMGLREVTGFQDWMR